MGRYQPGESAPTASEALLASTGEDLNLALEELRELGRGLHPSVLSDRGLEPAPRSLVSRTPFPVEIVGVPPRLEEAVYCLVAES